MFETADADGLPGRPNPIATLPNIGEQDVTTRMYSGPWHILLSVFIGTGVAVVVKYVLDKKWISASRQRKLATMRPCSRST
jgi:LPS O-antigen subunit length determinant protein (WzzB/FepE family)